MSDIGELKAFIDSYPVPEFRSDKFRRLYKRPYVVCTKPALCENDYVKATVDVQISYAGYIALVRCDLFCHYAKGDTKLNTFCGAERLVIWNKLLEVYLGRYSFVSVIQMFSGKQVTISDVNVVTPMKSEILVKLRAIFKDFFDDKKES